ncbi:MAG TPA: dienelactone hydrolase family protein [Tepidisphaeraceae bacterium]|nr:dienelactone hydrolase family protein [Tepidisphaeraceae bacterium]
MQRPIMDSSYIVEARPQPRPRRRVWRRFFIPLLKCFGRLLVSRPLALRRSRENQLPITFLGGLTAAFARQAVFLVLALAIAASALAYAGTHPTPARISSDPGGQGVYFDQLSLPSTDGTPLHGWLVPAIDARRVVEQKERVLRERWPAVVLVHDFGRTPEQMLPLVRPLHEEGIVVLALGLRGAGEGWPAGQTFGLHESRDIRAAVEFLRRRAFVDPDRIAVVGFGTGATAALLAAQRDATLSAIVFADPVIDASDALARQIGPKQPWLKWLRAPCKWTFELGYRVNADDINFDHFADLAAAPTSLRLAAGSDRPNYLSQRRIAEIREFLVARLHEKAAVAGIPRD